LTIVMKTTLKNQFYQLLSLLVFKSMFLRLNEQKTTNLPFTMTWLSVLNLLKS